MSNISHDRDYDDENMLLDDYGTYGPSDNNTERYEVDNRNKTHDGLNEEIFIDRNNSYDNGSAMHQGGYLSYTK